MELMNYELPDELKPFEEALLSTRKSFIEIIPEEDASYQPWQSCFGGHPYLLREEDFPTTSEGEPLFFLAQINLEELPSMPGIPAKGLLQFFIFDDELYGQDPDDGFRQDTFRVVYHAEILRDASQLVSDFSFLPDYKNTPIYPNRGYKMSFEKAEELAPATDKAFETAMGEGFFKQFGEAQWDIFEGFVQEVSAEGHKIGGYPHFPQEDPREPEQGLVLLFQMDSDVEMECIWGDMGTAHFFIREDDLKKGDFSKVMYHWDCH